MTYDEYLMENYGFTSSDKIYKRMMGNLKSTLRESYVMDVPKDKQDSWVKNMETANAEFFKKEVVENTKKAQTTQKTKTDDNDKLAKLYPSNQSE